MLVVYSLPHCPKCNLLKSYLNSMNIQYEERNAQDFVAHLTSHGFRTAPVLEIDGILYDFTSVNEVMYILRSKGYSI